MRIRALRPGPFIFDTGLPVSKLSAKNNKMVQPEKSFRRRQVRIDG
jgi:hypothetical protein